MLDWRLASDDADRNLLARFCCWDGDRTTWWIREVQNHTRAWLMDYSEHIILFTENGALIAVSAFSATTIAIPLVDPIDQPAWFLDLVAVSLHRQGNGLSSEVYQRMFSVMRDRDPERILVTGLVHEQNTASLRAARKVGIDPFIPVGDGYLRVLGETALE